MKEPESLQQVHRTLIRSRGRELVFFSGCDYLRLSSHPRILAAIREGLRRFGVTVAASRRTTGNHAVYQELERELCRFFGAEAAVVVSTGYVTNLVVAQALAGNFSHALVDERSHVSPQEGAQAFNCPVLRFKHRDAADLARALRRCGRGARPVVLTDGMFSGDGSVAPLRAYLKALPRDGLLVVDDAHGAGTIGARGGGATEVEAVDRRRVVQCVTLSKAFGCFGGAVLSSRKLREQIVQRSNLFIGSTPLPLPLGWAAIEALRLCREDAGLRARLHRKAEFVKDGLRAAGLPLPPHPGPSIPFPLRTARDNARLRRALLAAGIYPSFIQYPGGPAGGYFRFVISSEHSPAQLERLVATLKPFVGSTRQVTESRTGVL